MYNFTEDAHPIHLHLVRFQVVGAAAALGDAGCPGVGVQPWETGYKDTVIAYPGEITTVGRSSTSPACTSGTATSSSTRTTR